MKADHLSFSRAASVCLLGLLLQAIMGLALMIYGGASQESLAITIAFMVLVGMVVWLTLAIVFDQHRRERIEAMEAESLNASGGRAASVFESNPDDLRVAGRRLAWMHRVLVPVMSMLLAVLFIGFGLWRFFVARPLLDADKFAEAHAKSVAAVPAGWAIAIGLIIAVIGFIFARFFSGMAKQAVWGNLRGGAAAAVGAAIMGLALALGHVIQISGSDIGLRYLQVFAPGVMIFLGVEILLNLMLNLYRPRKQGEIPRPAMDSRVLAFIASPDRLAESIGGAISYQFGVDVTGSWAYQLLSRSVLLLVLVGSGVIWLLTCLEVVQPNERAVRVRNGMKVEEVGPGLHFKLPWPFETLDTIETTRVRRQDLASPPVPNTVRAMLWTNDHAVEEVFAIVQPSVAGTGDDAGDKRAETSATRAEDAAGNGRLGQEISLLSVEIPLRYTITDLTKYAVLGPSATRDALIVATARREALAYLATCNEDDVLGRRIPEISAELHRRVQKKLDELNAGVKVQSVGIEGSHPTKEAAKDFESVVESIQKRAGKLEQGRTEAIKTLTSAVGSVELAKSIAKEKDALDALPEGSKERAAQEAKLEELVLRAGGKAASMISQARADRWTRHMLERGRAQALAGQIAAYQAAPAVYRMDLYLRSLQEMMKGARVFITNDDPAHNLRTILDLKDVDTTGNVFTSPTATTGN